MATVATVTRKIFIPTNDPSGGALQGAIVTLLANITANTPTIGPFKYFTADNAWLVIEVSWPSANDTAFMTAEGMAAVATALSMTNVPTEFVTSTSLY